MYWENRMKENQFDKIAVSTNLIIDQDQSVNKHLNLRFLLPDGAVHDVMAIFPDDYFVEFKAYGRAKLPQSIAKITVEESFIKYLLKVYSEMNQIFKENSDWYTFSSFLITHDDYLEDKSVSTQMLSGKKSIEKHKYLVTYRLSSVLNGDWKYVDFVIDSNFALNVDYRDLHPLLHILKKLNPSLELDLIKKEGEVNFVYACLLKNPFTGVVVKVINVEKQSFPLSEDTTRFKASYLYRA